MRKLSHLDKYRVPYLGSMGDDYNGTFELKLEGSNLAFFVIATNGGDWDHVSVSTEFRCPRWHEMQQIKDLFFNPEEVAMQLHPAESEYVNNHPYCLHIWRPQKEMIPVPPAIFVGFKGVSFRG